MRAFLAVLAIALPCSSFAFPIRITGPIGWSGIVSVSGSTPSPTTASDQFHINSSFNVAPAAGVWHTSEIARADAHMGVDTYARFRGRYTTTDLDELFETRFTFTAEAFASVDESAPEGTTAAAWLDAAPALFMSFDLHAPAQYLGTIDLYGFTYGDILAAGSYTVNPADFFIGASAESTLPGMSDYSRRTAVGTVRLAAVPVPEPGALLLLSGGLIGVAFSRRRARAGAASVHERAAA